MACFFQFHIFAAVYIPPENIVSKAKPIVNIRIVNLFGEPLLKDAAITASVVSVQKKGGSVVSLKKALTASSDKYVFLPHVCTYNYRTFSQDVSSPCLLILRI